MQVLTSPHQDLPRPGAQVLLDSHAVASWSYDNASQTMITYDTPGIVSQKVEYIKTRRLGGAMWWETSDDRPSSSNDSLIGNAAKALGGLGNNDLEKNENCLDYPQSKYDNLRQGMPDE
jgi:chitinase